MLNGETILFAGGHYEQKGNEITKYYTSTSLSASFAGSSRIAVRKYTVPETTTLTWLVGDHLGSTSLAVDASTGEVIETRYRPWGEVRWTTEDKSLPTRYTFTGQYSYVSDDATDLGDAGFGLMFYNARWYDPAIGRFAQADTIVPGGVQGLDRYAYVNNSPINYVDPTGHVNQATCNNMKNYMCETPTTPPSTTNDSGAYHHDEDTDCTGHGQTYYDYCTKYYFVTIESVESWDGKDLREIYEALDKIFFAFGSDLNAMYRAFGNVTIKMAPDGSLGTQVRGGKVYENTGLTKGHTITLTPSADMGDVVHEFGHVFDNHMNNKGSRGMITRFNKGTCSALPCPEGTTWILDDEEKHTEYGEVNPYEDFADSFEKTVGYYGTSGAGMYISDRRQWYILSLIFNYRYPYPVVHGR